MEPSFGFGECNRATSYNAAGSRARLKAGGRTAAETDAAPAAAPAQAPAAAPALAPAAAASAAAAPPAATEANIAAGSCVHVQADESETAKCT